MLGFHCISPCQIFTFLSSQEPLSQIGPNLNVIHFVWSSFKIESIKLSWHPKKIVVLYEIYRWNWKRPNTFMGLLWSWSYGRCISNYLCNQWLSLLALWVWIPLRRGVLDTALCDQVCQGLATGLTPNLNAFVHYL